MPLKKSEYDAVVVGSGPNGLAAAITLAETGKSVLVLEAAKVPGGGCRSAELTLPGFIHDVCSAVHPLAVASAFFRSLPLDRYGLEWIEPPAALAHPFDDEPAALMYRSVSQTAHTLRSDGATYSHIFNYWSEHATALLEDVLAPLHFPAHPYLLGRFGLSALRSADSYIRSHFREKWARGMFAGLAAHSFLPLTQAPSNAVGLVLAIAGHAVGWPIPRGGAQKITDALTAHFRSLGGEIATGVRVTEASDLPAARAVCFDINPSQLLSIAGDRFPNAYRRQLEAFRSGPGVFKLDYALSAPVPWKDPNCALAATVHLGGTFEELVESERAPWENQTCDRPFVLVAQSSLFDSSRAPAGKHTLWAYCHVPRHSTVDMSAAIEGQIERFAPGFKKTILARHASTPKDLETYNANYVGGDISGGIADMKQALFRPTLKRDPYSTPLKNWFLCSASTPPGAGVHGMCGQFAARSALKRIFD